MNSQPENFSPFEKLLVGLVRACVDFAAVGDVHIPYLAAEDLIFLKQDSWRDKDKLDVQAMREIIAREGR
jgi:hypothetical protein